MTTMPEIEARRLPAQTVAYQRSRGTLPSVESATAAVRSWAVTMGYAPRGPLAVEIEGEPGDDPAQEYEIEVQLPIVGGARAAPSDQVQVKRLDAAEAAVLTLHGPADLAAMATPWQTLRAWLGEHGVQSPGTVRWVEVTDPARATADDQVTELHYIVPAGTLDFSRPKGSARGGARDARAAGDARPGAETPAPPARAATTSAPSSMPTPPPVAHSAPPPSNVPPPAPNDAASGARPAAASATPPAPPVTARPMSERGDTTPSTAEPASRATDAPASETTPRETASIAAAAARAAAPAPDAPDSASDRGAGRASAETAAAGTGDVPAETRHMAAAPPPAVSAAGSHADSPPATFTWDDADGDEGSRSPVRIGLIGLGLVAVAAVVMLLLRRRGRERTTPLDWLNA